MVIFVDRTLIWQWLCMCVKDEDARYEVCLYLDVGLMVNEILSTM